MREEERERGKMRTTNKLLCIHNSVYVVLIEHLTICSIHFIVGRREETRQCSNIIKKTFYIINSKSERGENSQRSIIRKKRRKKSLLKCGYIM